MIHSGKKIQIWLLSTLVAVLLPAFASAKRIARGPANAPGKNITDVVEKVRQDDEGITILFKKSQGSYYLRNTTIDFDKARGKLEKSLSSKKPVQVTVEPEELNILEVK